MRVARARSSCRDPSRRGRRPCHEVHAVRPADRSRHARGAQAAPADRPQQRALPADARRAAQARRVRRRRRVRRASPPPSTTSTPRATRRRWRRCCSTPTWRRAPSGSSSRRSAWCCRRGIRSAPPRSWRVLDHLTKGRVYAGLRPRLPGPLGQRARPAVSRDGRADGRLGDRQAQPQGLRGDDQGHQEGLDRGGLRTTTASTTRCPSRTRRASGAGRSPSGRASTARRARSTTRASSARSASCPKPYQQPHPPLFQPFSVSEIDDPLHRAGRASCPGSSCRNPPDFQRLCQIYQEVAAENGRKLGLGESVGAFRAVHFGKHRGRGRRAAARRPTTPASTNYFGGFGFWEAFRTPEDAEKYPLDPYTPLPPVGVDGRAHAQGEVRRWPARSTRSSARSRRCAASAATASSSGSAGSSIRASCRGTRRCARSSCSPSTSSRRSGSPVTDANPFCGGGPWRTETSRCSTATSTSSSRPTCGNGTSIPRSGIAPRRGLTEDAGDLRLARDGKPWGRVAADADRSRRRHGHDHAKNQERWRPFQERGWTSKVQVEAMDIEGIDVAVIYPSRGLFALAIPDMEPRLAAAMARAYNDWLYEFCQENPERLLGAGMISPFDVDDAVAETRRCVRELGFPQRVPAAERGERPELARSLLRALVGRARGARSPARVPRGRRLAAAASRRAVRRQRDAEARVLPPRRADARGGQLLRGRHPGAASEAARGVSRRQLRLGAVPAVAHGRALGAAGDVYAAT